MEERIKSYTGEGKYIFVSYSHDDKEKVMPIIQKLQTKYNVWFDEGLEYGNDFIRTIIKRITNCSLFLYFMTLNSLSSDFCEREIDHASEKEKLIIPVVVEDVLKTEEAEVFRFKYRSHQMCMLYKMTLDDFVEELERKAPQINETKVDKPLTKSKNIINPNRKTYISEEEFLETRTNRVRGVELYKKLTAILKEKYPNEETYYTNDYLGYKHKELFFELHVQTDRLKFYIYGKVTDSYLIIKTQNNCKVAFVRDESEFDEILRLIEEAYMYRVFQWS